MRGLPRAWRALLSFLALSAPAPAWAQSVEEVLASTLMHHPALRAARTAEDRALGVQTSARGGLDFQLTSRALVAPLGYYRNQRFDVGFTQNTTLLGASVSGGYRLGVGDFASYYGERRTLDAGEFALAVKVPLLQDRALDRLRVDIAVAELGLVQADIAIQVEALRLVRLALDAWWRWVGAHARLEIAEDVLQIAETRRAQIARRVQAGALPEFELLEIERVIQDRIARVVAAQRDVQRAAVGLSLFWRNNEGLPRLPVGAAAVEPLYAAPEGPVDLQQASRLALEHRPELRDLTLRLQVIDQRLALARNQRLARLDATVQGSQDIGGGTDDEIKTRRPFELAAGLNFNLPVQRRAADGAIQQAQADTLRVDADRQTLEERIQVEVADADLAWRLSWQRAQQLERAVQASLDVLNAEQRRFDLGATTLFQVNLREQAWAESRESLAMAWVDVQLARVAWTTALGWYTEQGPPAP
jgi:outer membrane protein TolC